MSFWTDPYIEGLSAEGKLLYIYLFTCPLVNNLGIMETTAKRIAYETDIDTKRLNALLADMEKDGKLLRDGNIFWLVNFIKNQCTTSPKLLQSMKDMLQNVESKKIRRSLCIRYPHIFECGEEDMKPDDTVSIPYPHGTDTVDIPSGELGNRNRELRINTPPSPSQGETVRVSGPAKETYTQEFEVFWQRYPKKAGKDAAFRAWKSKKREGHLPAMPVLLDAIDNAMRTDQWQRDGGQYIPHPATWLNQGRWMDEQGGDIPPPAQHHPPPPEMFYPDVPPEISEETRKRIAHTKALLAGRMTA